MQQAPVGPRAGNQNLGNPPQPAQQPLGAPLGGHAGQARVQNQNLLGPGYEQDPKYPTGGGSTNFGPGNTPIGTPVGGLTASPYPGIPVGAIPSPIGGYIYNGRYYQTGENPFAAPQTSGEPGATPPEPPTPPDTPLYTTWQYGPQPDPTAASIEDFLFNRFSGPGAYDGPSYALDPLTMRGIPMDVYRRMQQLGTWNDFRFSPEWQGYQGPLVGQTLLVDPSFDFSRWITPPQRPPRPQPPTRPAPPLWQQRRIPTLLNQIGGP
jgi:hypothetical protein